MIDVEALLQAVSESEPAGPNREYDLPFGELERAGAVQTDVSMVSAGGEDAEGGGAAPPAEPNWKDVYARATEMLGTTKDLRPALHLVRASFRLFAFPGLERGLALIKGLVERYWADFHPQLDPDDDNDPTIRVNLLGSLADQGTMLSWLRTTPFLTVPNLGRFSLRDLQFISGEMAAPPPGGEKVPTAADLEAAFRVAEYTVLETATKTARSCATLVRDIERLVDEKVGGASGANMQRLRQSLDRIAGQLEKGLATRAPDLTEVGEKQTPTTGDGAGAPVSGAAPRGIDGEVRSRADVLKVLDKICAYYDQMEPSSPVPMLLRRARKLATMSFFDIVRNLAPNSLDQIEVIRGPEDEPKSD